MEEEEVVLGEQVSLHRVKGIIYPSNDNTIDKDDDIMGLDNVLGVLSGIEVIASEGGCYNAASDDKSFIHSGDYEGDMPDIKMVLKCAQGESMVLDVAAANLWSLIVRSCFRFPHRDSGEETEVVVWAPSMGAVCWYRSYPKRLAFLAGMAHVRRLAGLKLPALGRTDRFDFPYTLQLLRACYLVQHLGLDLVIPDQMALLNWLGPGQQGSCEDLLSYVPQLPNVSVASLTLSWGSGGSIAPSLASFLSRLPNLTRLHIDSSPYCFAVLEAQGAVAPRGQHQWGGRIPADKQEDDEKIIHLRLDSLREISVDGLNGTDRGECAALELLLADAQPPLLQRVSLSFRDVATPVIDEIACEVRARFPMAAGHWTRRAPTVLAWTSSSELQC